MNFLQISFKRKHLITVILLVILYCFETAFFLFDIWKVSYYVNGVRCVKSVRIWSYSSSYSVQIWENKDQNNSEYGHFLGSGYFGAFIVKLEHISHRFLVLHLLLLNLNNWMLAETELLMCNCSESSLNCTIH